MSSKSRALTTPAYTKDLDKYRLQKLWRSRSGAPAGGVVVLVDEPTITIDASLSGNFRVTLGGNRTLANPTNLSDGQVFNIRIKQDDVGGRTLSYGSMYAFPGGVAPVLTTAADALDFMSCQYDAADGTLICVMNKAFEVPA